METYAVVESGGKQYRVTEGQRIQVDRMSVEPGSTVTLDRVLLVANDGKVTVGNPTIKGAKVIAQALGEEKGKKIIVFRYKPKTKYRRKTGHRQSYTNLAIQQIATAGQGRRRKAR